MVNSMLKIKDNVDLNELKKYGFNYCERGFYRYDRTIDGILAWTLYITRTHHNIQIIVYQPCTMAKELQTKLYDLIQAGLIEKVNGDK